MSASCKTGWVRILDRRFWREIVLLESVDNVSTGQQNNAISIFSDYF